VKGINMQKSFEDTLKICVLLAILLTTPLILGCINKDDNQNDNDNKIETRIISIGTVSRDVEKMIKRFQPTADYIAEKLSDENVTFKGKVVLAENSNQMVQLLKEEKIDLYFESPMTALNVAEQSGAEIFLRRWKQNTAEYNSVIVVRTDSDIHSLHDLLGKNISFESPDSTSGYLLPKAHIMLKGFNLSEFVNPNTISYQFTQEDENTALWVVENKSDAGAFSNLDFEENPIEVKNKLRIIEQTISIPRHVVVHRPGMESTMVNDVRNILINMEYDLEGQQIMEEFKKTKRYDEIPNKDELLDSLKEMLILLGLLTETEI
jgi:phosphate/phosphite/phosphonate ABC transporter binding protein